MMTIGARHGTNARRFAGFLLALSKFSDFHAAHYVLKIPTIKLG